MYLPSTNVVAWKNQKHKASITLTQMLQITRELVAAYNKLFTTFTMSQLILFSK